MKKKALRYYQEGYNCAQCIIKAAAEQYGFELPKESLNCCRGVNNGFGIGGICSALVGAVMVFGLLFEAERARLLRLELFLRFHEKHESLNCCSLSTCNANCNALVEDIAQLTEGIIQEEFERMGK